MRVGDPVSPLHASECEAQLRFCVWKYIFFKKKYHYFSKTACWASWNALSERCERCMFTEELSRTNSLHKYGFLCFGNCSYLYVFHKVSLRPNSNQQFLVLNCVGCSNILTEFLLNEEFIMTHYWIIKRIRSWPFSAVFWTLSLLTPNLTVVSRGGQARSKVGTSKRS